jgi:hypothetical protein
MAGQRTDHAPPWFSGGRMGPGDASSSGALGRTSCRHRRSHPRGAAPHRAPPLHVLLGAAWVPKPISRASGHLCPAALSSDMARQGGTPHGSCFLGHSMGAVSFLSESRVAEACTSSPPWRADFLDISSACGGRGARRITQPVLLPRGARSHNDNTAWPAGHCNRGRPSDVRGMELVA